MKSALYEYVSKQNPCPNIHQHGSHQPPQNNATTIRYKHVTMSVSIKVIYWILVQSRARVAARFVFCVLRLPRETGGGASVDAGHSPHQVVCD